MPVKDGRTEAGGRGGGRWMKGAGGHTASATSENQQSPHSSPGGTFPTQQNMPTRNKIRGGYSLAYGDPGVGCTVGVESVSWDSERVTG